MTVLSSHADSATRTMTFVAEFTAPVAALWRVWAERDLLEKWWGPPAYPATVTEFVFEPGGVVRYVMVGDDDGERIDGRLVFVSIVDHAEIVYDDVFIPGDGGDIPEPDNRTTVTFEQLGDGSRMTLRSTFHTVESFAEAVEYGAEQGYVEGIGQIDALLAEA